MCCWSTSDDNFYSEPLICDSGPVCSATARMCLRGLKLHSLMLVLCCLLAWPVTVRAFPDKTDKLIDKINLEQSIAAVFNKVAYGSTTKRSIPDNSYPVTTLATPLLTTYRYSDGSDEWLRVDVKSEEDEAGYGTDLEKDHGLPTSAPAAEILKNNNNRNYNNPNRYNNDRLRPDHAPEQVTESFYKTTTGHNVLRNVRPTKSIFSKDIPSYVPPNKALFTPPLPDKFIHPFADKPTLRGTNSDSFANKRPFPRPSLLTPNKDQIPYRPDLTPASKPINVEKNEEARKKTLNTPSQNVGGEFYRSLNETGFEYEKGYIPSITRILSGSNGRHDEIPDILLKSVTDAPLVHRGGFETKHRQASPPITEDVRVVVEDDVVVQQENKPPDKPEGVTSRKAIEKVETTTEGGDALNLPNIKSNEIGNVTKADSDKVWLICWNVHVYLVVFLYVLLAVFSIFKLIRYENDPHMFSKSYFLTVHLMLTVISVLRIFYLTYDPYNVGKSFNVFLYEFLHNFPLSLLATTFAVLILFLLKRTLNHLKVKTRPVFLVVFAVIHICMCFCLSVVETLGHFDRASLVVCKPVFVLLTWALGFSYLYLYKIIKNVLAKKTQNLSEMCTQNISYASHITIAVALLFVLLGFVQLYSLFFIKVDRFATEIRHHWILWGFELSVRVLEISIVTLLAIVVSLKMSQREKQTVGFPLFPCTTSDSSTDNIFPNNCTTNPNALNYSRNEMALENVPAEPAELKPDYEPEGSFGRSRKFYVKPKFEIDEETTNVYSEPIDNQYFERRSARNSTNTSGRRTRARKNHARPHLGVQTLPGSMLVDDQGFVRFRHLQDVVEPKRAKRQNNELQHYDDGT